MRHHRHLPDVVATESSTLPLPAMRCQQLPFDVSSALKGNNGISRGYFQLKRLECSYCTLTVTLYLYLYSLTFHGGHVTVLQLVVGALLMLLLCVLLLLLLKRLCGLCACVILATEIGRRQTMLVQL